VKDMYVSFATADDIDIVVEVDEDNSGVVPASVSPGDIARKAKHSLDDAMGTVQPVISSVFEHCRALSTDLDEISVSFGLKFSADLGAILTKVGAEANLTVNAIWKRSGGGH
jgi:hypothetical protein